MSFIQMMRRLQMTKQKMLWLAAVLSVACCIIIVTKNNQKAKHQLSYTVFKSKNGWGYNILVDTSILIHQAVVPIMQTQSGFGKEQQAQQAAALVLQKLKTHKEPTINNAELQAILLEKDLAANE